MSLPTLFLSDVHLDPARPGILADFIGFLDGPGRQADSLYILGDLFEAWIGDDVVDSGHPVLAALARLTGEAGVPVWFMHGNRDFLIGPRFAALTGVGLLEDPCVVAVDGEPVLLMHGDSLCTDDHAYQSFRATVRNPDWQAGFLALPVEDRLRMARNARDESSARNRTLAASARGEQIMDVNPQAVEDSLRRHGVQRLIHGHTHRPGSHRLLVDGRPCQRWVLGDWYDQGSVLRCQQGHWQLQGLDGTPA